MLLAVDVGNTHTVLGLYDGEVLVRHFRVESAKGRTADELEILLMGLAQLAGISHAHVTAAILASVVPDLNAVFAHAIHRAYGSESLLVGPGIKTGMPTKNARSPKQSMSQKYSRSVSASLAPILRAVARENVSRSSTYR